jgi:hypothetical protein
MNAMPVEQRPKLLLKRFGPMMLPLVLDVMNDGIQSGHAHAECPVLLLPTEAPLVGKGLMNPFRGASFNQR